MSESKLKPFEDPTHELNGPKYKTGKKCIEPDCLSPAGTYWSPYWCFECNVKRMERITQSLEELAGNARGVAFPETDGNKTLL